MVTRSKIKKPTKSRRALIEQLAVGVPGTPPLKIDETAGIIFRVKVLGRFSRNSHNLTEAENGTEYTAECMRDALRMYEGSKVKANHPADRTRPGAERDVYDTFGVLRNCVVESDEKGDPAVWADLHYLKGHKLAPLVIDDVQRGLGVYGLSHNAQAGRERFDRATRRLVIESLSNVRSVDLVDKPATNRNLWESEHMTVTRRQLLESVMPSFSPQRQKWCAWLLEDDMMADAPAMAEAPAEDAEPEDKLWAGICDAIMGILDKKKSGEMNAVQAGKAIAKYLKAHEKLTGSEEPEDVEEEEEEDDDKKGKGKDVEESEELKTLRTEKKVRELCESLDFTPNTLQTEMLVGLPEGKRKAAVESFKGAAKPGFKTPKSGLPQPAKKPAGRNVQESTADPVADLDTLRNG